MYGARAADFLDDAGAYIKDMYNSSKIGKHFPIKALGGPLVEVAMNEYRNGGGIHIKPSHRGRLTELKRRTGKTEAELYRTGSPATRKMITFARSARKWKHGLGGNLFAPGGDITYSHPYYSYDENGQLIKDENGKPILNYNATLPEVEIIGTNRNYPLKAKQERARQREIAKNYFASTPTPSNIYKGIEALVNSSLLVTTAATVNPNMVYGIAPTDAAFAGNPLNSTTSRFLKFIEKPLDKVRRKDLPKVYLDRLKNLTLEERAGLMAQEKMLQESGVDMSKLDIGDIIDAYDRRALQLAESNPERYTIVRPTGENGFDLYDIMVGPEGTRTVGKALLYGADDDGLHMGWIENVTRFDKANKVSGVQERGLNSAINTAQSVGKRGVITGEDYQYAPLQLHVVDKFPNREILPGRGHYSNINAVKDYRIEHDIKASLFEPFNYVNNVEDMRLANPNIKTYFAGPDVPAFMLTEPTMHVPTKASIFDPRRLTEDGRMIIDWSNPFIFNRGGSLKHDRTRV